MKTLVGVALVGSILILTGSGCGEESSSSGDNASKAAESKPPPPPPPTTPKQRVTEELGDEVSAGGYAGDVEIQNVTFGSTEVQVTAKTPEGGLQGASCGDLDDGAQAIFQEVYDETGWKKGAVVVFKGGLVDSATGKDLPDANTGIFTMPPGPAKQIDWSNDDALANINWEIYRDFCHPALE